MTSMTFFVVSSDIEIKNRIPFWSILVPFWFRVGPFLSVLVPFWSVSVHLGLFWFYFGPFLSVLVAMGCFFLLCINSVLVLQTPIHDLASCIRVWSGSWSIMWQAEAPCQAC